MNSGDDRLLWGLGGQTIVDGVIQDRLSFERFSRDTTRTTMS